jgi:hypothetical protein
MIFARRMKWGVIALAVTLCIGGYAAFERANLSALIQPKPIVMKLRRTCTACPNYTITLSGDGLLTYEGGEFALVRGVHQSYVDVEMATTLFNEFVQSEFLEMDNTYPAPGDDRLTVALFVETAGLAKGVFSEERYGPALRQELERKMDDLPGMRALSGWTH